MLKILSIDPSIQHAGYAIFSFRKKIPITILRNTIKTHPSYELIAYDAIKNYTSNLNWIYKMDYMISKFLALCDMASPTHIIIEQPECYTSPRGSASLASGAIPKLFSFVFSLRQALLSGNIPRANIILVTVSRWKGQCPKDITMKRMLTKYNLSYNDVRGDHNITDAIGLGDWYMSFLSKSTLAEATLPT